MPMRHGPSALGTRIKLGQQENSDTSSLLFCSQQQPSAAPAPALSPPPPPPSLPASLPAHYSPVSPLLNLLSLSLLRLTLFSLLSSFPPLPLPPRPFSLPLVRFIAPSRFALMRSLPAPSLPYALSSFCSPLLSFPLSSPLSSLSSHLSSLSPLRPSPLLSTPAPLLLTPRASLPAQCRGASSALLSPVSAATAMIVGRPLWRYPLALARPEPTMAPLLQAIHELPTSRRPFRIVSHEAEDGRVFNSTFFESAGHASEFLDW